MELILSAWEIPLHLALAMDLEWEAMAQDMAQVTGQDLEVIVVMAQEWAVMDLAMEDIVVLGPDMEDMEAAMADMEEECME